MDGDRNNPIGIGANTNSYKKKKNNTTSEATTTTLIGIPILLILSVIAISSVSTVQLVYSQGPTTTTRQ